MTLDYEDLLVGNKRGEEAAVAARYDEARQKANAYIRDLVLEHRRIDVLAEFVLGYPPLPFHVEMMEWQDVNQEALILAWRGAAKTTYCTITRAIFEILQDPDTRILIASDAVDQAKVFLRSIKSHFENNERFREIFGDWVGDKLWAETEITVSRRKSHAGEPTIMCVGTGTTLPSRHFEIILCDDLVTKDNSQTEGQRKKVKDYFYETLYPTLESPDGRLWLMGTRWDEEDLYGWLQKEDYAGATMVIPVLDEDDRSRWEEKYPTERMLRIRKANLAAFELQYMCRTGVGLGGIFTPEHFIYYDGEFPRDAFMWQGVDLAAGQKARNDFFAHVTMLLQKHTRDPFLVAFRKTRMPFPAQVRFIAAQFAKHPETVKVIAEANAYQISLKQQMAESFPAVPVLPRYTIKDKVARAQQVAMYLTDHPCRVRRGHHEFVRLLCGFPGLHGSKDVFDAFEIALGQSLKGHCKTRDEEPGLI